VDGVFNYDRWYPLWDREIAEFYNKVPLRLRKDKKLQKEFTNNLYINTVGLQRPTNKTMSNTTNTSKILYKIRDISFLLNIDSLAYKIFDSYRSKKNKNNKREIYEANPQYGFIPKEKFLETYNGKQKYNFYLRSKILKKYIDFNNENLILKEMPKKISNSLQKSI